MRPGKDDRAMLLKQYFTIEAAVKFSFIVAAWHRIRQILRGK
jgi:hypothetical protein